jgi:mannosyltransferase
VTGEPLPSTSGFAARSTVTTATSTGSGSSADDTSSGGGRAFPVISPRWVAVVVVAVLAGSIALRFIAPSPLWLDESQNVNIAHRSIPHLFKALREDGSPPLYYLLLHVWMKLFGTGSFAVRALSGLFAVAALPLMGLAARQYRLSARFSWWAVLILATSPFAVRYASETRMYSLVVLLVLLALLAYERVWTVGGFGWGVAAAVVTGALVLTQYWSLFLVATVGAGMIVVAWRGDHRARRCLVWLVIGCLAFAPWLPTFLYQNAHTGAPWGVPPGIDVPVLTPFTWTGAGFSGPLLALAYYVLVALAVAGYPAKGGGLTFRRPLRRAPSLLLLLGVGTLLVGTVASEILVSAFADRYSIIALAPLLLVVSAGFAFLPTRARPVTVAVVCALGLVASSLIPGQLRTQAGHVATALNAYAAPGDLVLFCPDQLGPAVYRLAPNAGRQAVYPTFASPALVDWVNYAKRNENADPVAFTQEALKKAAGHTIWYVYANGYRTFNGACMTILSELTAARGAPDLLVRASGGSFERDTLAKFEPR